MGLKYIENTGRNVMFVGGKLIPPGEGREVDEALLPPELMDSPVAVAAVADPSVAELVAELLKGNAKTVVAELVALTGEALDLVETIEGGADAPRKGVLEAVTAERIRRASQKLDGEREGADGGQADGGQADGGQDEAQAAFDAAVQAAYQKQLDALTPEQLAALGEDGHAVLRAQAQLDAAVAAENAEGGTEQAPADAPAADTAVAQRVAELLKGNAKMVMAALVDLTAEELALVEATEGGADAPRKTVLAAVTAELVRRQTPAADAAAAA